MKLWTSLKQLSSALLLAVCTTLVQAGDVENVRMWLAPDNTRLVFDLDGPASHKVFMLRNPDRLVLDVKHSQLKTSLNKLDLKGSPIANMRSGRQKDALRIVLDLNRKVQPKSFELPPNDQYGHRLVLDLETEVERNITPVKSVLNEDGQRDVVVVIDAGHGGEDPGAIGPGRVREKDVVLAIAKEVARLVDREPGYRAELVRTGDYYVSLRGRTKKARTKNANLFVSIHADAFKDKRANGASVWVLSNRGASSEVGRWLARSENAADAIGGVVKLNDKDKVLASVLLDMSMTANREDSLQVAANIHGNIAKFAKMHKPHVEKAGFVVLKSPGIPSVLVETGFISNPREARNLKSPRYQRKMAQAIFAGIKSHFWREPPVGTYLAQLKAGKAGNSGQGGTYVVSRGDTLSLIASRKNVSLSALRRANGLKNDTIWVGQKLKIPTG